MFPVPLAHPYNKVRKEIFANLGRDELRSVRILQAATGQEAFGTPMISMPSFFQIPLNVSYCFFTPFSGCQLQQLQISNSQVSVYPATQNVFNTLVLLLGTRLENLFVIQCENAPLRAKPNL